MKPITERLNIKSNYTWTPEELSEHKDMWYDACEELGIIDVVDAILEFVDPETSTEMLQHLCDKYNINRI